MLKQSLKAFKLFQHRFNILSTRFNNVERGWQTLSTLPFNKIERMLKQMLKPFARAFKWNHRTCNSGISQQQYRAAVRAGAEILWFCPPCRSDPVAESSRVSGEFDIFDQSNYILESEEFNPPRESFDQSTIYDPHPQVGLFFAAHLTGI